MHIPVHSLWLPGYINVVQTILIILTMAGLFPDRPHIFYACGCIQAHGLDFQSPWHVHSLVHATTFKTVGGTPSSFHLEDAFPPFEGHLYETELAGYPGRL